MFPIRTHLFCVRARATDFFSTFAQFWLLSFHRLRSFGPHNHLTRLLIDVGKGRSKLMGGWVWEVGHDSAGYGFWWEWYYVYAFRAKITVDSTPPYPVQYHWLLPFQELHQDFTNIIQKWRYKFWLLFNSRACVGVEVVSDSSTSTSQAMGRRLFLESSLVIKIHQQSSYLSRHLHAQVYAAPWKKKSAHGFFFPRVRDAF